MSYDMHHKHDYFNYFGSRRMYLPESFDFSFQILNNRGKKSLGKYLESIPSFPIPLYNVFLGF